MRCYEASGISERIVDFPKLETCSMLYGTTPNAPCRTSCLNFRFLISISVYNRVMLTFHCVSLP